MATLTVVQDFFSLTWTFTVHANGKKSQFSISEELIYQYGPKYIVGLKLDSLPLSDEDKYSMLKYLPDKPGNFKVIGTVSASYAGSTSSLERASCNLPGIMSIVTHPVNGEKGCLQEVIISLNDHHKWTREQIADWLDEISDPTGETGPDLRFKIKEKL